MSVFTRAALEGSPLADLHTIAAELGLDGFRRLRKADLVDRILEATGGDTEPADHTADDPTAGPDDTDGQDAGVPDPDEAPAPRPRRTRGGRGRSAARDSDPGDAAGDTATEAPEIATASASASAQTPDAAGERPARRSRGGRGRRAAGSNGDERGDRGGDASSSAEEDRVAEGVVEVLDNGSGFLRVNPPEASDDDVYVSAAQVRRCELVTGDRIGGSVRPPRRSERYPSLIRIDQINDRPADEIADTAPFDELPATFPTQRFALDSEDATLQAVEWLTPIGRGSRVTITGAARAGKTETFQRLAGALAKQEDIELSLVLVGVRPEETRIAPEGVTPTAGLSFATSADAQGQAVERAIDAARRVAARGGHAVVLIDSLDGLHPAAARKALAAARAVADGGTLTVVATATAPLGGETTVIALDETLTGSGRLPALDLVASGTVRPELLVGEAGASAIAAARASALDA